MQNNNRSYNKKKIFTKPKYTEKDFKNLFTPPELTTMKYDGCSVTTNKQIRPARAIYEISGSIVGIINEFTTIQKFAIPAMADGSDVLIKAPTGMGKTLCFLIHAMKKASGKRGLTAVVISPIRELAEQIKDEANKIAKGFKVKVDALYGKQINKYHDYRQTNLLIATPGKLLNYIETKKISLDSIETFVLDEADHLLDMGFDEDIKRIYSYVPSSAQVCLFSATYNNKLYGTLQAFLSKQRTLVEINIDIPDNIKQEIIYVDNKYTQLVKILKSGEFTLVSSWRDDTKADKILIFVQRKSTTEVLQKFLTSQNISCNCLHGDKDQVERNHIMKGFRDGQFPILIATSVAARGIDVKNVKLVINYDIPNDIKEYIHRIGRTGREGKVGRSILFYDNSATPQFRNEVIELLKSTNNDVPSFLVGNSSPVVVPVATENDNDLKESDEEVLGMW